jgi:acetyl esterase/lipase
MIDLTVDAARLAPYTDPFVHPEFSTGLQKLYWSATELPNSDLSPVESDLNGLPPILILIAENDILRGEAEQLTSKAIEAGVDCRVIVWPHVWHGWHILVGELPEARQAMRSFAIEIKSGVI